MSWLRLSQLATMTGGRLVGGDAPVESVNTDTRTLGAGQLFVALRGPNFDGHDFIAAAEVAQAAGALTTREVTTSLPQVVVPDALLALQRLAAQWRAQLKLMLVGLTGSNGKTTVKEMIASIFSREGPVLATQGNLNNHIGVPLTLLSIRPQHAYAVVEMGANHAGEIAVLTAVSRPDIALITNAAAAHLEGFGSVAGVARAKGEIFQGLGDNGTAVINADDAYADYWRGLSANRKRLTFGIDREADARACEIVADTWRMTTPAGEIDVKLPLPGRHNVRNALAATAVAIAAGIGLVSIKAGLESMTAVRGRLAPRQGLYGARLLDDSYNANPGSLAAALDVLKSQPGERWLVLGDMAELGGNGEVLHRQAGEMARATGVVRLYTLGKLSRVSASAFGAGAESFDSHALLTDALIAALRESPRAAVSILIKGSRSARMEKVVDALVSTAGARTPGAEQEHAA